MIKLLPLAVRGIWDGRASVEAKERAEMAEYTPQLYAFITEFYKAREWLLDRNPEAMRYAEWRNESRKKKTAMAFF